METGRRTGDEHKTHGFCENKKSSICPIILLTLILVFAILTVTFFLVYMDFLGVDGREDYCSSSSCIKVSAEIREFLNESVDPCDDFYQFVCGKFHGIASEKQISNPLQYEHDKIENLLNSFITEPQSEEDSQSVLMQKAYYQSCLSLEDSEDDQNEIFFKELDKIGGWPFLGRLEWKEANFSWVDVMSKAREAGLPFQWFLKIDLSDDDDQYILEISNPTRCTCNYVTAEYFKLQTDILEKLTNPGIDTVFDLDQLKTFEKKLCSLCKEIEHKNFNLKSVMLIRNDNWFGMLTDDVITAAIGSDNLFRSNFKIAFKDEYIHRLGSLLMDTPKRVQASYILWKIIEAFLPYLSNDFREIYTNYKSTALKEDVDRFQFCLDDTKSKFKYVSEMNYLQKHVDPSIEEEAKQIVDSIREELVERVQTVQWKNNQKLENSLKFYKNLDTIIGVSTTSLARDFFFKYPKFEQVNFASSNLTQIVMDMSKKIFKTKMGLIGGTSEGNLESSVKLNVNIDRKQWLLVVPAFNFHGFLYKSDVPRFYNYAGLGSIVSLELIRGLNLLTNKPEELFATFEENRKCLIDSLKNENIPFKPFLAFYKNYEDLVALDLSYNAYQKYVEANGEENQLLDLEYSPQQMFWIKSGITWCYQALTNEDLLNQLIAKYKINEAAKNSPNFASDFECSPEAPMNPKNKCQLF